MRIGSSRTVGANYLNWCQGCSAGWPQGIDLDDIILAPAPVELTADRVLVVHMDLPHLTTCRLHVAGLRVACTPATLSEAGKP